MIKLFVIYLADDDPKKCTAKKMERFNLAGLIKRKTFKGGIVLSPFSKIVFSKDDYNEAYEHGIYAVDVSWKNVDKVFSNIRGEMRRLPFQQF